MRWAAMKKMGKKKNKRSVTKNRRTAATRKRTQ
jgi:hypothetical protein